MKIVEKVGKEEKERDHILAQVTHEEESFKIRQEFIKKKEESQKTVKKLMEKHRKEAEFLDKAELNEKLNDQKKAREIHDRDAHLEGEAEEGEAEEGEEEQHGLEDESIKQ